LSVSYVTVNTADFDDPPSAPEIVAVDFDSSFSVDTAKLAAVFPAGMVTVSGTVAKVWLLVRVTTMPPAGATLLRVTSPTADLPPTKVAGLTLIEARLGELTVRLAVSSTSFKLPVTVAIV